MAGDLGELLKRAGLKASEPVAQEPASEAEAEVEEAVVYAPKVVVRRTKKGHGGKTVTLVSGVMEGRDPLAKTLRKHLGVGTRVDGEDLVIQGDQRERVARWLESEGAKKVIRS